MRDCDFLGGIANDKVVLVHTQPIFSIVDGNEVLDQVFVRLAYTPAFAFLRAENVVVVQRIINYGITWNHQIRFSISSRTQSWQKKLSNLD